MNLVDVNTNKHQIQFLEQLVEVLEKGSDYSEKLQLLPDVSNFLHSDPILEEFINHLDHRGKYLIKALIAIGQGPVIFHDLHTITDFEKKLFLLIEQLATIEKFYDHHGGLIGYHLLFIKLLNAHGSPKKTDKTIYKTPSGIDISKEDAKLNDMIRWGLESMQSIGEMYPVGGAGDRLDLRDSQTGEPLPAAQLMFCGRSLLELLLRDLQGCEFLYYKLFDRQIVTPIAIMTSDEKDNDRRIKELCRENKWFGRPEESFHFFLQPMVPVITIDGDWVVSEPLQLTLKPGGHGVIWKAALDAGIYRWFEEKKIKKVLIRQINNPIAGTDTGLLALKGIGCKREKDFGFASCKRFVASSEGMDVLREVAHSGFFEYCITNVEYTDFAKKGVKDCPESPNSPFSLFPSNTNILFGDLKAIQDAIKICPFPGILINLKHRFKCHTNEGYKEIFGGRLESTMQNIADYMVDKSEKRFSEGESRDLRTFLTYNKREKTISVVKELHAPNKPLKDTPEGCFFDLLNNYRDLLINYCKMKMPPQQSEDNYLEKGPDCVMLFHPALGTLYSIIAQKIRGGRIGKGSEMILEIAEVEIVNLDLEGSLIIESDGIMGKKDSNDAIIFDSNFASRCTFIDVKVRNAGRMFSSCRDAWKCEGNRKEALRITLHENAEFFAENIELIGDVHFDVPAGHRLVVYQQGKEIAWHFEKISNPSWIWEYSFEEDGRISLKKVHH